MKTPTFRSLAGQFEVSVGETVRLPCLVDRLEGFVILWKKGEIIIEKGAIGDKFYFIKSGECVVMNKEGDGKLEILAKITGHASFGELALLTDEPRSAYVAADSEVELYSLTPLRSLWTRRASRGPSPRP